MPQPDSQLATLPPNDQGAFETALARANGRVRVQGLRSAPQHNGEEGVVVGQVTGPDGSLRWNVRCLNGVRLALKMDNLEPVLNDTDAASQTLFLVDSSI